MPTKKGGNVSSSDNKENLKVDATISGTAAIDSNEPFGLVMSAVDKKTRNLEKRKLRLKALDETRSSGKELDKDQLEAIRKLPDVTIQIDTLRDLSATFQEMQTTFQKEQKKQQKSEEKQRREAEKETQRSLLKYSLRVQGILNLIDDAAKAALRTGTDGAVELKESELAQLDEFYEAVNPSRPGNDSYSRKLTQATDHLILLFEKSNKEIAGTTYDGLHKILDKLDTCGYFDKVLEVEEEEEEEEEEDEEEEQPVVHRELEETVPQPLRVESPEHVPSSIPLQVSTEPNPIAPVEPFVPVVPMTTEGYHPSAPSPDFSGLQTTALSPLGELTFMRESPTHPLIEQEPQTQFTGGNFTNYESGDPHPPPTNTSSFFSPPPPSNEPTPVGVLDTGTLLLDDNQYAPETGQQLSDDKGGHHTKDSRSSDYNNTGKGAFSHRGSGKPWRGGGGGYRGNSRDYNGGSNYGRGGYNQGRGGGQSNYRGGGGGGSNRGRPNYTSYNGGRPPRGGGGGSSYNRQQVRQPMQ